MNNRCIHPAEWLLPADQPSRWACVACDQFTSQPEYWAEARRFAGDTPSAINLILPECDLDRMDECVPQIHETMLRYLADGALVAGVKDGFILTERTTESGARLGLVAALDLECYDYRKGSRSLVRATEETIESRLPARMQIRRGAAVESGHVLMLMDDPMHTVLEPLHEKRGELTKVYDFPLMMNGGHLRGWAVTEEADISRLYEALDALAAGRETPLLFAVGDGNHSLASARAYWNEVKANLSDEETVSHPARFAMVEIENIHDEALRFEPIHRVVFGCDGDALLQDFRSWLLAHGASLDGGTDAQVVECVYGGRTIAISVTSAPHPLAVGTLQLFLDEWLKAHSEAKLDYVHGDDTVHHLAAASGTVGFLLPCPDKSALFSSVENNGVLPRKTFSMGSAHEKRYYMECRRL